MKIGMNEERRLLDLGKGGNTVMKERNWVKGMQVYEEHDQSNAVRTNWINLFL